MHHYSPAAFTSPSTQTPFPFSPTNPHHLLLGKRVLDIPHRRQRDLRHRPTRERRRELDRTSFVGGGVDGGDGRGGGESEGEECKDEYMHIWGASFSLAEVGMGLLSGCNSIWSLCGDRDGGLNGNWAGCGNGWKGGYSLVECIHKDLAISLCGWLGTCKNRFEECLSPTDPILLFRHRSQSGPLLPSYTHTPFFPFQPPPPLSLPVRHNGVTFSIQNYYPDGFYDVVCPSMGHWYMFQIGFRGDAFWEGGERVAGHTVILLHSWPEGGRLGMSGGHMWL